jgi:hypothetical protein
MHGLDLAQVHRHLQRIGRDDVARHELPHRALGAAGIARRRHQHRLPRQKLRVARNLADAAFEACAGIAAAAQVAAAVFVAASAPELEQVAIMPLQSRP